MRPQYPRQILQQANTEAFFVTNLVNIHYLTGVELTAGSVLVEPTKITLFTDARYTEAATRTVTGRTKVRDIGKLETAMKKVKQCGFEADDISVSRRKRWVRLFKNTKFVQRSDVIDEFRRSKEPDELQKILKSQRITRDMYKRIPKLLKQGITELELAWKIQVMAHEAGADGLSFDPIVAFGSHTSSPHHHPTDRKLKKRDIIQIDMGVKYQGYCSDQSRVFFVGDPTGPQARVYEAVEQAKMAAEKAVTVGIKASDIDAIARESLGDYAEFFTHSLGHGVGLEIHEGVSLSARSKQRLLENEIVTIEPGVYLPGKFGIRLEDEIVVKA